MDIDFSQYEPFKPVVYAVKCPKCGTLDYPAPMICKNCGERRDPSGEIFSAWEKVTLEGKCKLLGWTKLYALPEGIEKKYLLFGVVEFENGLRAIGRLLVEEPKTGMELVSTAGLVREVPGEDVAGFIFDIPG
ncbi:hypothetical protein ES705_16444 [subsurface metagenome]